MTLKYYREEYANFPNHNKIVVENFNIQNLVNQITDYFKISHLDVLFDLENGNVVGQYRTNKTYEGKFFMGKRCSEISFRKNRKLIPLLTIVHEVAHHWDYEKNGQFRIVDNRYRIKWRKAHTKKHKYMMKRIFDAYDRNFEY